MKKIDIVKLAVEELVKRLKDYRVSTSQVDDSRYLLKQNEIEAYERVLNIIAEVKGEKLTLAPKVD